MARINGVDLPRDKRSGLGEAMKVLKNVQGVSLIELTAQDVVRHELVQRSVRAYEMYEKGDRK